MATSSNRRWAAPTGALLLVGGVLLSGCGSDSDDDDAAGATTGSGAYPVTVEHAYGETEIESAPQRVVSLGYTDQDAIVAFGVVPVAVRYAFGPEDDVFFPWSDDAVDEAGGDADVEILPREEIDPETVAALAPDLIVAVTAGLTEAEYDTYSQIAPTIVQPAGSIPFGTSWQDQTRIVGQALGQPDRADELVAEVEGQIEQARAEHPEFAGKTVTLSGTQYEGAYPFHTSDDPRTRFFLDLGMVVDPALEEVATSDFYGTVSREQANLLNADVLVFQAGSAEERKGIEDDDVLAGLTTVAQGHSLFIEDDDYAALQFASATSIPFLLDDFLTALSGAVA